jgi:aminopeptidase Y
MRFPLIRPLIGLALVGVALQTDTTAQSPACGVRVNNTFDKLLECVTIESVREHQAALQRIADDNNGHRFSGSAGFDQSVAYVAGVLADAGYAVTLQPFQLETFFEVTRSVLDQIAPPPAGPVPHNTLTNTGSGDATAPVFARPAAPAGVATPGCEAADFAGFPVGDIALISRGACTFALKATNAYNAGASGVIIYNNIPGALNGTLGLFTLDIGVTSVT